MVTIRLGWVWIPILIFFGVPFVVRTAGDWIRMGRGAVTGWRAVRAVRRGRIAAEVLGGRR